jgi:hypothetical protein
MPGSWINHTQRALYMRRGFVPTNYPIGSLKSIESDPLLSHKLSYQPQLKVFALYFIRRIIYLHCVTLLDNVPQWRKVNESDINPGNAN